MKKRAILIHGWEGSPKGGWQPWLRRELEKKGFAVDVPAMPDSARPTMSSWVEHLCSVVGTPDSNCYLNGHSLGCITILRYLETLKKGERIGGAVLVAGFSDNLGYEQLTSFFATPIDWSAIRTHCDTFVSIMSDNDPYVPLKHGDVFRQQLGAEVIVQHDMKHFSGDDGIIELPIALESLLKIAK